MPNVPTLETQRLVLREVTAEHISDYEKHFINYEIIRYLTRRVPWPYPPNGVADYLNTKIFPHQGKDQWMWGIFLKSNPAELIGTIDLWRTARPENRGFWLSQKHWGKGYMTEAAEVVMDYAFGPLKFEKLRFANAVGNTRSGRVKHKTGAVYVRTEPAQFVDPAFTEHEIYELTKEQWQSFKKRRDS